MAYTRLACDCPDTVPWLAWWFVIRLHRESLTPSGHGTTLAAIASQIVYGAVGFSRRDLVNHYRVWGDVCKHISWQWPDIGEELHVYLRMQCQFVLRKLVEISSAIPDTEPSHPVVGFFDFIGGLFTVKIIHNDDLDMWVEHLVKTIKGHSLWAVEGLQGLFLAASPRLFSVDDGRKPQFQRYIRRTVGLKHVLKSEPLPLDRRMVRAITILKEILDLLHDGKIQWEGTKPRT